MSQPLHCPFCGRSPERLRRVRGEEEHEWHWVVCDATRGGCGASQSGPTAADALDKWNTRFSPTSGLRKG